VAVVIRLARHGQTKRPFYRIVAADKERRRDGRFLDIVGTYNPMVEPPEVDLKEDLIKKWLDVGAKPSLVVSNLIKKAFPGLIEDKEKARHEKILAKRRARKQRIAARAA
jgi:small subunit ribosomal protein S16